MPEERTHPPRTESLTWEQQQSARNLAGLWADRERARAVAVALEQELAELRRLVDDVLADQFTVSDNLRPISTLGRGSDLKLAWVTWDLPTSPMVELRRFCEGRP